MSWVVKKESICECESTAQLMAQIRRMRAQTDGERGAEQVETEKIGRMRDKWKGTVPCWLSEGGWNDKRKNRRQYTIHVLLLSVGSPWWVMSKVGHPDSLYSPLPHTHTCSHTHWNRPSSLMLLISIITSPRYWYTGIHHARAATGGTAPGRADGSHSGGSEEREEMMNVCVWVGLVGLWWYRKRSGGIGFWNTGVMAGVQSPNYARSPTAIRSCQ